MKIAILSFAHMHAYSYAHALKSAEGVELAGVWDADEARGRAAAERYSTVFYPDYRTLLEQDLDAVVITSENVYHHEQVLAAARAGKHVLCEKPLATTTEDAQEMIDVCREAGVLLQIAFPVRYNTAVKRAQQLIEEGKLGRLLALRGTNRGKNPGGWFADPSLSGGGAVMDHTVHVVDVMRWFTASEVKEVYAEADKRYTDKSIDDCGILTLEFDSGVFATLDCSWSRNPNYPTWGDVTLEIVGTAGTLSLDAFGQYFNVFLEDGSKQVFWGDDMDKALINDFIASMNGSKAPLVTGNDGLRALEVALAAYRSAETHEPVVIRHIPTP